MILAAILILQSLTLAALLVLITQRAKATAKPHVCGAESPADALGETYTCILESGHEGAHSSTDEGYEESEEGYYWQDVPFLVPRTARQG